MFRAQGPWKAVRHKRGARGAWIPKRRLLSLSSLWSNSHVESAKECIGLPSNGADVLMNAYKETTGDNETSLSETPQLSFAPSLGLHYSI